LLIWWNGKVGVGWKTVSGTTSRLTGDSAAHGGDRHAILHGFYWARLLQLRMSSTTWRRRIIVVKFAGNPCPRGMETPVLDGLRYWLPIYGQKVSDADVRKAKEDDAHLICMFSRPSPLSVSSVSQ